jgi:hypothetical protein
VTVDTTPPVAPGQAGTTLDENERARFDLASGVLCVPRGQQVAPCPFPCSVCRAKGRQLNDKREVRTCTMYATYSLLMRSGVLSRQ